MRRVAITPINLENVKAHSNVNKDGVALHVRGDEVRHLTRDTTLASLRIDKGGRLQLNGWRLHVLDDSLERIEGAVVA